VISVCAPRKEGRHRSRAAVARGADVGETELTSGPVLSASQGGRTGLRNELTCGVGMPARARAERETELGWGRGERNGPRARAGPDAACWTERGKTGRREEVGLG
jgi:hypothetical protein